MSAPLPPVSPVAAGIVAVPAATFFVVKKYAHPTNYSRNKVRTRTQAIVLHATDGHEGPSKAEDVAAMFAKPLSRPRSCTWVTDSDTCLSCVPAHLTAWHCGHTGNARTEGVELCGFAAQTRGQWLDPVSIATLNIAARLVAKRCAFHSLPAAFVNAAGLLRDERGITTHYEVSKAWKESDHTDPGPHFPIAEFCEAVRVALIEIQ